MKFYLTTGEDGSPIGCEFSLEKAKALGKGLETFTVETVIIDMAPREALRRLLGQIGGYANGGEVVYERVRK